MNTFIIGGNVGDSPASRRSREQQNRQTRIKQAAWTLFTRQGFEATTIRQIADQADVATGTVLLHAASKADLLLMVYRDELAQRTPHILATLPQGSTLTQLLQHIFLNLLSMYREHEALARNFLREVLFHRGETRDHELAQVTAFLVHIATLLRERQHRGELRRDVDPEEVTFALFAQYQASLIGWLTEALTYDQAITRLSTQIELIAFLLQTDTELPLQGQE